MATTAHDQHHSEGSDGHHVHPPSYYVKIWAVLCALLVVSVVGPMFEIRLLTLLTAFGIAIWKAYLVAKNFMHLGIERRYVTYLLVASLALMALFYAGVAPDVMKHEGQQWENVATKQEIERAQKAISEAAKSGGHH